MALEGQTPAEVAGVGVNGKNKWLAMLTETIERGRAQKNHVNAY